MNNIVDLENEFIQKNSWLVNENANTNISAIKLMDYVEKMMIIDQVLDLLPQEARKLHKSAWIHIHKLLDGAWYLPYCAGFDTSVLMRKGLKTLNIVSRPAKHFDTAIDQIINFIMTACQERTGAIALNFVDLYLAPYVRFDNLTYKKVKQGIQRLLYNLNYTTRVGYQTPFTNFVLGISILGKIDIPVYYDGKVVGSSSDYYDEVLMIFEALLDNYAEGDAYGRPFTFPIPTILLTDTLLKILNENPQIYEKLCKVTEERGQFYFLNSLKTDRTGIFSMCCRLTIDIKKVNEYLHLSKGVWSIPPSTGSIGYVSINLPRVSLYALRYGLDESRIFDKILELINVARKVLNILRQRYEKLFKLGLYPISREYIDSINPFKYYFNTISIVGIAEFTSIVLNDPHVWNHEVDLNGNSNVDEIVRIQKKVLTFMNKVLEEFEKEDHILYNLEQAPAESASTKFAIADYREFVEYRQYIPYSHEVNCPFYTSQNTPPYTNYRLSTQLYIESQIQPLYTGGVIKHIFTHRPINGEQIFTYIVDICHNCDIVYISYTPTQTICTNCGYRTTKLIDKCPKCGNENIEVWSRIVGYYRPLKSWNIGKIAEFYKRKDTIF